MLVLWLRLMKGDEVVASAILCRFPATARRAALAALLGCALAAHAADDKPGAVEKTAKRAGKFVEKTATRAGKFTEKTARKAGKFVDRTAEKVKNAF